MLYARCVDEQLQRLQEVLEGYPDDRALPDVDAVLRAADVPASLLLDDERAHKVWVDALTTRPFGDLQDVRVAAAEVELLFLEVRQVTALLRRDGLTSSERAEAISRVEAARALIDDLTRSL